MLDPLFQFYASCTLATLAVGVPCVYLYHWTIEYLAKEKP